jgi:thiol-disulfide isomerase/thioredoxin
MGIKKISSLLLLMLWFSCLKAQVDEEAIKLNNSLYGLWQTGNTKEAIKNSEKLFNLSPPYFTDNIHKILAQLLLDRNNNAIKYIRELYARNNSKINKVIKPIYLWDKALNTNNPDTLVSILADFQRIILSHPGYDSRAERYALLTLKVADVKNAGNIESRNEFLSKIIQDLQSFPYINVPADDYKANDERGWRRYLLAFSYDYLYSRSKDAQYLEKASLYSPDLNDQAGNDSYFYDAQLLDPGGTPDYRKKYWAYLVANGQKEEALKILTEFTFNYPDAGSIKGLKEYFQSVKGESGFKEYWYAFINSHAEILPDLNLKFDRSSINFNKTTDKWTYVDIWGTWCGPCLKDLPNLQRYYQANSTKSNANLDIYTFSYGSQNLGKFMVKNSYNFPVTEIDNAIVKKLKVAYYPTRILITPGRRYLKIPFNANWEEYINIYILND